MWFDSKVKKKLKEKIENQSPDFIFKLKRFSKNFALF